MNKAERGLDPNCSPGEAGKPALEGNAASRSSLGFIGDPMNCVLAISPGGKHELLHFGVEESKPQGSK